MKFKSLLNVGMLSLAIVGTVFLSGCGNQEKTKEETPTSNFTKTENTEQKLSIDEAYDILGSAYQDFSDMFYSRTMLESSEGEGYYKPLFKYDENGKLLNYQEALEKMFTSNGKALYEKHIESNLILEKKADGSVTLVDNHGALRKSIPPTIFTKVNISSDKIICDAVSIDNTLKLKYPSKHGYKLIYKTMKNFTLKNVKGMWLIDDFDYENWAKDLDKNGYVDWNKVTKDLAKEYGLEDQYENML